MADGAALNSADGVAVGGASPGSSGYASHSSLGDGVDVGSCAHAEGATSSASRKPHDH